MLNDRNIEIQTDLRWQSPWAFFPQLLLNTMQDMRRLNGKDNSVLVTMVPIRKDSKGVNTDGLFSHNTRHWLNGQERHISKMASQNQWKLVPCSQKFYCSWSCCFTLMVISVTCSWADLHGAVFTLGQELAENQEKYQTKWWQWSTVSEVNSLLILPHLIFGTRTQGCWKAKREICVAPDNYGGKKTLTKWIKSI